MEKTVAVAECRNLEGRLFEVQEEFSEFGLALQEYNSLVASSRDSVFDMGYLLAMLCERQEKIEFQLSMINMQ